MKQKLLFLLALAFVSISAMGQVTFTAIGGSDFDDGEGSKMACDGNINTKWCKRGNDDVDNCYLVVKASEATYIEGFSMTTGNDSETYRGRAPRDYTIFGSDNNTDWDVIYHQQDDNLIEDENFKTYTVYCNSKKMYKYFKLWIKASHNTKGKKGNDGRVFQISEFVLLPATQGMTLMSGDAKAMDGETGQKWEGNVPRSVVVKASLKCFLKGYQFTTGNDNAEHKGRNPKDWKVEGSNDQTNWTVLDTETGNTVMEDKNCYPYFFEVTSASVGYQYFRFTVSGAADGTYFQISELALKAEVAHEHNYVDGYCTICHRPDPAYMTVNTEGFYELGTAAQMKWWSAMVADGHANINAKLTADLELDKNFVLVGTEKHKYAGTFDGQGHTLTVNIVGTGQGTAPFHRTNGATIRNLTIAGTITAPANTDNYHTAGLVGFCENTTLQRCVVKAAIHIGKRYDQYSGGLIGHILSGNTTIEDCAFIGSIRGDDGYISNIAGLVAWGDDGTLTIRNSYVNATYTYVSGLNAILCRDKGSQNNLSHVYYSERSKGIAQDNNMNGNLGEQITNEQVKNGFLAYHLQAGRTDQVWGQTIGTDDEPLFTSDAAKHVYQVTFAYNDKKAFRYANYGNPIAGGLPIARDILGASYNPYNSYTLTFADGFDATTTVTADRTVKVQMAIVENGYFAVSSKADWKELCDLVNGGETGLNAKLTKDVDLGTDIVMLGTVHQQYSGTFDGQDHTLSFNWDADRGSYIAPFRNVNNATIQNLRTKGRIMTGGDYLSGLVMEANGTTTISRCVTDVDITGGHHSIPPYIAGMVTNVENGASVIITDCLVKGSITDASWFAGKRISGFVGGYKGTRTITNCLYLGTSKYGEYYTFTFDNNATLNNCYYLNACGKPQGTQITEAQLKNGEVARLLQAGRTDACHWAQTLGDEPSPYFDIDKSKANYVYYDAAKKGWVCDDFRLTDEQPLPIGLDFTAATVTYERNFNGTQKTTLCLPYDLYAQGFKAYTLSGGNKNEVHFKETKDKLTAYTPYYITADGTPLLGGTNIEVKAYTGANLTTSANGYSIKGTVVSMDNATAAAANAYILQDDGMFHKVTTDNPGATVPAYHAYIICPPQASGAKQLSVVLDGETTGIGDVTNEANDGKNGPVYDLQGRRVADRLDDARHQLPAGVYIVGGRKVIVK